MLLGSNFQFQIFHNQPLACQHVTLKKKHVNFLCLCSKRRFVPRHFPWGCVFTVTQKEEKGPCFFHNLCCVILARIQIRKYSGTKQTINFKWPKVHFMISPFRGFCDPPPKNGWWKENCPFLDYPKKLCPPHKQTVPLPILNDSNLIFRTWVCVLLDTLQVHHLY